MKNFLLSGLSAIAGFGAGTFLTGTKMNEVIVEKQTNEEKFRIMYQMMERWMRIKQNEGSLSSYFDSYNYKKIAIYGMGDIGRLLINELSASEIKVIYGIDKNSGTANEKLDIYSPDAELPEVDAVVVTAIAYFDDIEAMLSQKMNCPIISLEDIVYEVV